MKGAAPIWRILVVLGVVAVIYYFNHSVINNRLEEWFATAPDEHLSSARKAADDNAIDACLKEIDIAIIEMEDIEVFSDSVSRNLIDKSIADLKILEQHIADHELNVNELNLVFAKGINSLAYTYLKISEDELRHEHEIESVNSLKIVIDHLYNAMGFMKKRNIDEEKVLIRHIYTVIDSIQASPEFNPHVLDQLFDEIQVIIDEEERKLEETRNGDA